MSEIQVTDGCSVVLDIDGEDEPMAFRFAPYRPGAGDVVSPDSPIGLAIAGAAPGATATVQTPSGPVRVTVVAVRPAP